MERVASPVLADRETFQLERQQVERDGTLQLAGRVPGLASIRGIRWFVNGSQVTPQELTLDGNRFSLTLPLPPDRDQWTVYAIATGSQLAQFVSMREPLVITAPATSSLGQASHAVPPSGPARTRASLDFAVGGGAPIALAGLQTLHWYDGSAMEFIGWAIDQPDRVAPAGVYVSFDDQLFAGRIERDRPDVAKVFGSAAYRRSGFTARVPSTVMRPGVHHVRVFALNHQGKLVPADAQLDVAVSAM